MSLASGQRSILQAIGLWTNSVSLREVSCIILSSSAHHQGATDEDRLIPLIFTNIPLTDIAEKATKCPNVEALIVTYRLSGNHPPSSQYT